MAEEVNPTITVSITPVARMRLDYIQRQLGMNSRSATVTNAINHLYDKVTDSAHERFVQKTEHEQ